MNIRTAHRPKIVAHECGEETHTDITSTDFINTSKVDATAGESVDPKVTFDLTVYTVLSAQPPPLTERGLNAEVSAEPVAIKEMDSDNVVTVTTLVRFLKESFGFF